MNEAIFAVLVLMSANGGAMVKASEFLAMEDCEKAARAVRAFRNGETYQGRAPVIAICVPSFIGDQAAQ